MKIIINESQLRLIVENEEYINSIKELINTFDPNNIDMAFQIMKGLKIKQSVILDEYTELFDIFDLKPSKLNLIRMASRKEVYVRTRSSVPDILFKMPNLKGLGINIKNLGNLTSFNGDLSLYTFGDEINSSSTLESVGGNLTMYGGIKSLLNLKYVGGYLYSRDSKLESLPKLESVGDYLHLDNTSIKDLGNLKSVGNHLNLKNAPIESLPKLEYVGGNLNLKNTPLGKKLLETTTEDEIRNKHGVKGKIFL